MREVVLVLDKAVVDSVILNLVRSGYSVYLADHQTAKDEEAIAFSVEDDCVSNITWEKVRVIE